MRLALLLLSATLLSGCLGKISLTVERKLEPGLILPSASLVETVTFKAEAPPGMTGTSEVTSSLPLPSEASGWTVEDLSDASKAEFRMTRTRAGDAVFAGESDEMDRGLGQTAIRVTDYFLARKYEVKIAIAGTGEAAGAADPLSGALSQMLLSSVTYDHVVVMPGIVTSHDASDAAGSKLTWHVGLATGKGRILHAESVYPDPVRLGATLAAIVAMAATALLLRRWRRA